MALTNIELAEQSRKLHHQNSRSLQRQFQLTKKTARQIVKQCPICPIHHSVPHCGVNPRGITPNQLWQMDVTHVPSFGKLQYVHVTIDTFSGFLMATAQTGEATKHIINHCLHCFSAMGLPKIIKPDNGTGYTSKGFQHFCSQFNITHKTGIPYNPQGQEIVERAHGMLKAQLQKIKKGETYPVSPHTILNHTLFILNFLNLDARSRSAADRLWHPTTQHDYAHVK